jgi:hypothetical protein
MEPGDSNPRVLFKTLGKTACSESSAAPGAARRAPVDEVDAALQRVAEVWGDLPPEVRTGIVAMVTSVMGER